MKKNMLCTLVISLLALPALSRAEDPMGQATGVKKESPKSEKKAKKTSKQAAKAEAVRYTCPMHPDVVSDKPGKCPQCGMDLEKAAPPAVDASTAPAVHKESHEGHSH